MPSNNKIIKYVTLFSLFILSLVVSSNSLEYMITLPINSEQKAFLKDKLLDISNPLSDNWRSYLTLEEIRNISMPPGEIRQPILDWLDDYAVNCLDFGDSLKCNSTNEVAAKMWNLDMSPKSGALSGEIYIPEHLQDNIMFVEGDVRSDIDLKRVFKENINMVYHLAAFFANQNSVDYPEISADVDIIGHIKLLEYSRL